MKRPCEFKIVLLHEDLVSGIRGTSVLECLADQLEMAAEQLDTEIWKFDVLREAELQEQVIPFLRQANMIIISAGGCADLPGHIKEMIENALRLRGDRDAAIVALLNCEWATRSESPRLAVYLKDLAARTGLDFFCNQDETCLPIDPVEDSAMLNGEADFAV